MIVFDANMLVWLLCPGEAPDDPTTGQPLTFSRERIDHLVNRITKSDSQIIIPTPALTEFLTHADRGRDQYLATFSKNSVFRIAPFCHASAIEAAISLGRAVQTGDKRSGSTSPWPKIKVDRQIVAIAKVQNAHTIYSDDHDIRSLGSAEGIKVVRPYELPLPPESAQGDLGV